MTITRSGGQRRTETPNARMTTLASPSTGAEEVVVWRVEMDAGQAGPAHVVDREQVWMVLRGEFQVEADGAVETIRVDDAIVLPAGVERRVTAPRDAEAIVASRPGAQATAAGREPVVPPWTT